MVCAMLFFGLENAAAQNGNGGTNGAGGGTITAAFNQECNFNGPVTIAYSDVVSSCFAGGFITDYYIIPKINCNAVDCSVILIGIIGKVTTGCDGDVISVECYVN